MTIYIQEVEKATMLFVPSGVERDLHELIYSCLLQLHVFFFQRVLQQEPASLQSVT